ncbi:MAG: DAK2 domain-containing protein [Chloroflexota bacterium]
MIQNTIEDNSIIPNLWTLCDGQQLKHLFKAALATLEKQYEYVNQLNVFPIPDGDTGTNMLLTLRKAYGAIQHSESAHIGQIAAQFARGALMEARGNSGVILSQIFQGLADGLQEAETASTQLMGDAMMLASSKAYKSVSDPTEGTILTVIRETAVSAEAYQGNDLRAFFETVLQQSKQTLAKTPELLPILKESGVVDSGGQGLAYLFQGMVDWINGKLQPIEPVDLPTAASLPAQAHAVPEGGQLENPYDVQFLLFGENLDVDAMRRKMDEIGDSTVVVGDASLIKVHVHVKNPGEPLSYAVQFGQIDDVVVENMQAQMEAIVGGATETAVDAFEAQDDQIGVVAVVPGDGFATIFKSMRASQIIAGGQTNNPSVEDILNAIESVTTNNVIVLPNNKNILLTAETASQMSQKKVKVVPTKTMPQGLSAMVVLEVDGELEQTAVMMKAAAEEIMTAEVTRATRTVELDGVAVQEGDIIGLLNGRLTVAGDEITAVIKQLLDQIDMDEMEIITLYSGHDVTAEAKQNLHHQLQAFYPDIEFELHDGGQQHYDYILGIE